MNYKKIYDELIAKRVASPPDGYSEKHHIIPKALGGTNAKENLVLLTGREHFVAHVLLAKIHGGTMWMPVIFMKGRRYGDKYINGRMYQAARQKWAMWSSQNQRGENHHAFGKVGPTKGMKLLKTSGEKHWNYGNKMTDKMASAIRAAVLGRKHSEETKKKIGSAQVGKLNHRYGVKLTEEQKSEIGKFHKGRPKTEEHKKKIGNAHRGKIVSEETKQKMRDAWAKRKAEKNANV